MTAAFKALHAKVESLGLKDEDRIALLDAIDVVLTEQYTEGMAAGKRVARSLEPFHA